MAETKSNDGVPLLQDRVNWKHLCDMHPDPLMLLDCDHRVAYINEAQARALGCCPEEAVGRFCYELIHGGSGIPTDCPHAAILRGKATQTKEILVESLGGYFLVTVKALYDEAGRLEGSLHVARDLAILPTEDAEAVADGGTAGAGVHSIHLHNRLLFGRLLAEMMYRLSPDVPFSALRENMRREVARIAETLGFDRCVCWEAAGGGLRQTTCYARADAALPPLPEMIVPTETPGFLPAPAHDGFVRSESDGIIQCVAAAAAVAGELPAFVLQIECGERSPGRAFLFQNMMQVMCEGLSGMLRHAAALEETHALRRKLAQAEERTRLVQFAATLAHELNQPLAATLCNAQAAMRLLQQSPPDLEEALSALADIVQGAHRAAGVIDRTRALFKKGVVKAVRPINVERMADAALALMRGELEAASVTVKRAFAPTLPLVRGDEIHLQQVVVNLVRNALDAVREKPVSERAVMIGAEVNDATGRLVLRVSDSGVGIEAGQMEQIFEPFHTTKAEGMGMGLAVCRQIVEGMGGTIQVACNPRGGACLSVSLPVG